MNIVVIGGGTAGTMTAAYFNSYWGKKANIKLIYDHKRPGIGVGESLTPTFDAFLNAVGITTIDLIKNCNATIKLGLKFKNWTNNNEEWYHSFPLNNALELIDQTMFNYNAIEAYDILKNQNDGQYYYGKFFFENNLIPSADNLSYRHALHIDATLFSKFVESKINKDVTIIDGIVKTVNTNNGKIESLILESGEEILGDVFVDASGYERVLIKHLNSNWIDKSELLPTDSTIPNPIFKDYDYIPPFTTATATKNGWILDVPLSNRRGTGYVYSSKFTSDDEAREDFNNWLKLTHNVELSSNRIIRFSSGYYTNPWTGNCLAVGLSSGFVEPLEATSLHHLIIQIDNFVRLYQGTHLEFDRKVYNKIMNEVYENSFEYIRFFYNTRRTDSELWRYMENNRPQWLKDLEEKFNYGVLTGKDVPNDRFMFDSTSFNCVAYSHGFLKNKISLQKFLDYHGLYNAAQHFSEKIKPVKKQIELNAIDHRKWIDYIKSNPLR